MCVSGWSWECPLLKLRSPTRLKALRRSWNDLIVCVQVAAAPVLRADAVSAPPLRLLILGPVCLCADQ